MNRRWRGGRSVHVHAWRLRAETLGVEPLEPRHLLAGGPLVVLSQPIEQIIWQGQPTDVREGYWNGKFESATPYGSVAIPPALVPVTWTTTSLGEGFFSLVAPGADPQLVADWASQTPGVLAIEPDFIIDAPPATGAVIATPGTGASSVPNDPGYPLQWAPPIMQAPTAWDVTTGARIVVVAVLDSGLDLSHPDLIANTWKNPRELATNGIDDEKNGFVDDVYGWNFVTNTNNVQDTYGHGTHVSGIIGAVGNNGVGITGLGWTVSLMPLKILGDNGIGTVSAALAAMSYVTMMRRDFETNIVVSNNSWGASTGASVVIRDAIAAMGDIGITFVAAAGNNSSNNDVVPRYPSGYDVPNVISVAASDQADSLSSFSNYGPTTVDLAAPGSLIYSTLSGGQYGYLSGTSMAAPQVTGAIALLNAGKPGLTVAETRAAILGSTDTIPSMGGLTVTGGRLNINGAMKSLGLTPVVPPIPPPPAPPPTPAGQPFTDNFNQPNSPSLSGFWGTRIGSIGITDQVAVSRVAGASISTLNNVTIVDSANQAFVNIVNGTSVALVARYTGAGDARMYCAGLVRSGFNFFGRIWVNNGTGWTILACGLSPGGSGILRFDVAGSALTLFLNGRQIAAASNKAITGPGTMGIRFVGPGAVADNYSAIALTPPTPTATTSPFSDAFIQPNSPFLGSNWVQVYGNMAISNDTVLSRINAASLATLYGVNVKDSSSQVTVRDSTTQAVVNIGSGMSAGLAARFRGTVDHCMYWAGLEKVGDASFGRIWVNSGIRWTLLASAPVAGGSGRIRFDCIGSALTLYLNDVKIVGVHDTTLAGPGAVGLRLAGAGTTVDSYAYFAR